MGSIRGRILVYSIIGCPHCLRTKNKLNELNLPYQDISLDKYPQVRDGLKLRTGKTSVPQIFFNDKYIGGNEDFQKLLKNDSEWKKLLKYVTETCAPSNGPQPPDPQTAVDFGKSDEFVCEPDEYATLVNELTTSGIIKDHTSIIRNYKKSFKGQDLVDWLVNNKHIDCKHAMDIGHELVARNFGHDIKGSKGDSFKLDQYYRLIQDDHSKTLDYKSISTDPDFLKYVNLTKELQRVEVEKCSREEKLAFFINIYNALVIHASIKHGSPTNLWQRYKFFNTSCYIIGGHIYSLQDMENGVLRGNRKGVGMLTKPFKASDPRIKVALTEAEPLIHFALNCGAKSCPPIKTFTAKGVNGELKVAAESFFESDDALQIDLDRKEIKLSQIFKWYMVDFGGTPQKTVDFVSERLTEGQKKNDLMKLKKVGSYKVSYLPYDWGQNSKE